MALIGTRTAFLLVYCAAIGAIALAFCRPDEPESQRFEVALPMAVNHAVQPGELSALREDGEAEATKLIGYFARSDIHGGQLVRSEGFSQVPLLHVRDRTIVEIPVQGSVAGANAGSNFTLCKAKPVVAVTASALLCQGSGDGRKHCSVLAALPLQEARPILNQLPGPVATLSSAGCGSTGDPQRPQRPRR